MKVHELLDKPEKWTKHTLARTATAIDPSNAAGVEEPTAVCWCLLGAVSKCYPFYSPLELCSSVDGILRRIRTNIASPGKPFVIISEWNDAPERTFEDVYNLVKRLDI